MVPVVLRREHTQSFEREVRHVDAGVVEDIERGVDREHRAEGVDVYATDQGYRPEEQSEPKNGFDRMQQEAVDLAWVPRSVMNRVHAAQDLPLAG